MKKWATILLVLSGISGCSGIRAQFPPGRNSVEHLAGSYGVTLDSVEAVALAFGVEPSDLVRYGETPFPLNYIYHTLGWNDDPSNRPTVTRAEIDTLMTGYVSTCGRGDTITLYLYYSDWLSPKTMFRGEALPIKIVYEMDVTQDGIRDEQVVQGITYYGVGDSGGWQWEDIAPYCDPPARY